MSAVLIFGAAIILLLALLFAASRKPQHPHRPIQLDSALPIEELFPLHCRHFPQIRQALSRVDIEYLNKRGSSRLVRQVRAERRTVALAYLAGLKQDFIRLERLGRTLAVLAPQVSRQQETERLRLGLRFRVLYWLVWLRLATGNIAVPQLARLSDLVGSLAVRMESVMAALEEASLARLRTELTV